MDCAGLGRMGVITTCVIYFEGGIIGLRGLIMIQKVLGEAFWSGVGI